MSDYIDSQGFRANVGIVLMRDGGELFLGGRRDGRGWQFPQGGVPSQREARGGAVSRTARGNRARARRRRAGGRAPAAGCVTGCRDSTCGAVRSPLCIGQKQRWFLLRMLGDDSRLRFDATDRARIRRVALGRLLVAGARSHLFQAGGLRARAAGTGRSWRSPRVRRRDRTGGRKKCCTRANRRRAGGADPRAAPPVRAMRSSKTNPTRQRTRDGAGGAAIAR